MRDHIAKIVSAYLKANTISPGELAALITQVGALLNSLNKPIPPTVPRPIVPVRRSVLPDVVVCLDCGWQGKILRGHISAAHGLSPAAYRDRWGLSPNHALVAPNYSKRRSVLALSLGLGRRRAISKEATADRGRKSGRRGRPRKALPGTAG